MFSSTQPDHNNYMMNFDLLSGFKYKLYKVKPRLDLHPTPSSITPPLFTTETIQTRVAHINYWTFFFNMLMVRPILSTKSSFPITSLLYWYFPPVEVIKIYLFSDRFWSYPRRWYYRFCFLRSLKIDGPFSWFQKH